ncbi:biotin--[acetyl-CoA-carboxylase] ligase [Luteolibacter yonseiensis]|uniref:biotin--[biotin carboxyl-carrier protein] ligase n=1 Tax=Luteolibacter yonseiensis TaxID=1144680 RepID=A0A934R336_9BACT|nr:biotin--[acetyl-CoA-carboxylase] ligase [Luteolibacter yonseiensis]MBK1815188.1 biotin--[acetyl-CoA-carboxylase] ligase [Luteolibacter yonseiensis]
MNGGDFNGAAAGFPEPFRLFVRESVESTNDEVRELARMGAPDGVVVLAERQTAGRGRRGAAWFSPPGESLAFSILVKPPEPKALWPRLALAAGLAVAEALESSGLTAGIKWPNDVWLGGKKAAGILVEAGADFAVVGIGLNVNSTEFPEGVRGIATSMRIEAEREFERGEVLAEIIRRFAIRRAQIDRDFEELIAAVRVRCVLTGKQVALLTAGGPKTGIVEGIAPGGELLLRTTDGLERLMQADEVRVLGD